MNICLFQNVWAFGYFHPYFRAHDFSESLRTSNSLFCLHFSQPPLENYFEDAAESLIYRARVLLRALYSSYSRWIKRVTFSLSRKGSRDEVRVLGGTAF